MSAEDKNIFDKEDGVGNEENTKPEENIRQNLISLEEILKEVVVEDHVNAIIYDFAFSRKPVPNMWPFDSNERFNQERLIESIRSRVEIYANSNGNIKGKGWDDIKDKVELAVQTLEDNLNMLPEQKRGEILASIIDELEKGVQKKAQVNENDTVKEPRKAPEGTTEARKDSTEQPREKGESNGSNNPPATPTATPRTSQEDAVERFARLLIAKERIGGKNRDIINEDAQIRIEFIEYVEGLAASNPEKSIGEAFEEALQAVGEKMDVLRSCESTRIYRFSRRLRSIPGSLALIGLGIAGVSTLPASTVLGTAFISAYAIGRFISTYAGLNSSLTLLHRAATYLSTRKPQRGLGAAVIYGSKKGIRKHARRTGVKSNAELIDAVNEISNYAERFRALKITRHIVSALGALALTAVSLVPGGFPGRASEGVYGKLKEVAKVANPTTPNFFTAGRGEGMWNLAEKALNYHYGSEFSKLSTHQKNVLIDALKDKMVSSPSVFGLGKEELISKATSEGGPWLRIGATAEKLVDKSIVEDALGKYADILSKSSGRSYVNMAFGAVKRAMTFS